MSAIVLYAPNVHVGGGFVLLSSLLSDWQAHEISAAFLDARAQGRLVVPKNAQVHWVKPTIASRLYAEWLLYRSRVGSGRTILCFHGLPPLLDRTSDVVVFLQNRLYIERAVAARFSWRIRCRLAAERAVFWLKRRRVDRVIVQTHTMRRELLEWYLQRGEAVDLPDIEVCPFAEQFPATEAGHGSIQKLWDFVYVADGQAHKNHRVLVEAWKLLAGEGVTPTLAVTLGPEFPALIEEVQRAVATTGIRISNLGVMTRSEVFELYATSRALIFPSLLESFGLPLVEATHLQLPILAPELDYVREACVPAQTFDATSPASIAHAVRRHLRCAQAPATLQTPADFMRLVQAKAAL